MRLLVDHIQNKIVFKYKISKAYQAYYEGHLYCFNSRLQSIPSIFHRLTFPYDILL